MRFIDEVKITVISGNGGPGSVSFRREKHVAYGGPDGGDGGDGGDVYFQADDGVNTLVNFRGKKLYKAECGEHGGTRQCNGKYGDDHIIKVPVGTIVRHGETGEILVDLTEKSQKALIAQGGRGGLGNMNYKTATNQAPRFAQDGTAGLTLEVDLELRLIADIALVGLPNAGKSTLISCISSAKPKIADYAFTTLEPNLGVVKVGEDKSLVVADIPGLIEDASIGKGLGHKFLKHIERTSAFVHLVDCSWCLEEYEAFDSYITIRDELVKYNEDLGKKREIICLTKIDAMTEDEINRFVKYFESQLDKKVLALSSISGRNVDTLKTLMLQSIETNK